MSAAADTPDTCPNCDSDLAKGMVLCVQCGYDLRTGQVLEDGASAQPEEVPGGAQGLMPPPSGGYDDTEQPKSKLGRIIKLVILVVVLIPIAYVGYMVMRTPEFVVKGNGRDLNLRTWKRQIGDSQLWTFYFDHRRTSRDCKYPLVEFDITDKTEGSMDLRGVTHEFNVITYGNDKQLYACTSRGRNQGVHEVSEKAVRTSALGTIARRIEADPAILEKVIRETKNPDNTHAGYYISICSKAGAEARPATSTFVQIMTDAQTTALRQPAFDAIVVMYGGDFENKAFIKVLEAAIETADAVLFKKVRRMLKGAGKDGLPILKTLVVDGAPATKKEAQDMLDEYRIAQARAKKARAIAEATRKARAARYVPNRRW